MWTELALQNPPFLLILSLLSVTLSVSHVSGSLCRIEDCCGGKYCVAFKLATVRGLGRTPRILVDAIRPGCSTDLSSVRKHTCSGQSPQADGGVPQDSSLRLMEGGDICKSLLCPLFSFLGAREFSKGTSQVAFRSGFPRV